MVILNNLGSSVCINSLLLLGLCTCCYLFARLVTVSSSGMAADKKRKLEDYAADLELKNGIHGHIDDGPNLGFTKRAEMPSGSTAEMASGIASTANMADTNQSSESPRNDVESNTAEWTVIDRKQKKRKRSDKDSSRTKYPALVTFDGSLHEPIKLGELQNLIFYTLADGLGPKWVAFKHSGHTRKVVCLMVPGLEMSMFDTISSTRTTGGTDGESGAKPDKTPRRSAADDIKNVGFGVGRYLNGSAPGEAVGNPLKIDVEEIEDPLKPLAEIFGQVWPVKAPGDMKYAKLHSPIQALLVSPLPQSQEEKKMKGPRPPRESQSFQATRTPVTEYLLTPDDLREAEYPMHAASCETPDDKEVELKRREALGQTATNGWVDTAVTNPTTIDDPSLSPEDLTAGRKVYAIDCEMVLTTDDHYSLARISLIDWTGKTLLDELVKPSLPVKNYYTEFSGMTPDLLAPVTTTLLDIQTKLLKLIDSSTILLGHSLESDLSALKLTHPYIIDTSLLYPHPRGPPLRSSLKFLTQKYLRREIQKTGAKGHDSVEDALAVLDLVKLKCEKGPKYGTSEMSGESIFRRLSRAKDRNGNPRTTAIVDYGTPERGYGKDATHAIGYKTDEEIVQGVKRAVTGDADGSPIKGGGVDFVWARLREFESFRGWANNNREYSSVDSLHSQDPDHTTSASLSTHLAKVTQRIKEIYDTLPPTTLFMIYSGTGDPREVGRLQAMQRQYKREFQTKKWDECSVKWTDVEEQALRKAVAEARMGVAFLGVK